jgi:hypothetical protein
MTDPSASLITRRARFLSTAPPRRRPVITPAPRAPSSRGSTTTETSVPSTRRPCRRRRRKSPRRRDVAACAGPGRWVVAITWVVCPGSWPSGGQTRPALGPAAGKNAASPPGPHPHAEPVRLCPPAIVRLVRTFHESPCFIRSCRVSGIRPRQASREYTGPIAPPGPRPQAPMSTILSQQIQKGRQYPCGGLAAASSARL